MKQNHSKKINLMGLSRRELEDFFVSIEEKPFRATQIIKWIHQRGVSDVSQMTDLSKALRQKLEETCEIKVPEVLYDCLLYTSPSPRDRTRSRMPSSA